MPGYPEVLKYFMWPWQVYFRIGCQTSAESLFNYLDKGLHPNTFLIGFASDPMKVNEPICIEPEELHYRPEEFVDIQKTADNIYNASEERNYFYTGEGMQEEMDNRLRSRSFRLALEKTINESPNNAGKICFATSAVRIEQYYVFVVLELNKNVYESHTHLKTEVLHNRMKIYKSLLETSVNAYLEEKRNNLYFPDPGKSLSMDSRSSEELLREATNDFVYTVSVKGENFQGLHGLLDRCNKLSIARYEGAENFGQLIICPKNNEQIDFVSLLEEPFELSNIRKTRKLLQLTNEQIGVISDSYLVYGLGKIIQPYDEKIESVFSIIFKGVHCWDIVHNDAVLLQMRYGMPQFPQEIISREQLKADAKRIFPDISPAQIENLYTLSITATNQRNGAMLVVAHDAEKEAERLRKQSFKVQPFQLTSDTLLELSSIDGGILIDTNGTVHAYGVILDGVVGTQGSSARGSRYNSAVTYHENRNLDKPTLIIVVSEDGMVDVIPTLMPQIKHSEITQMISLLEELSKKQIFEPGPFNSTMGWLRSRQFYLTQDECNKINTLKKQIEEKSKPNINVWIVHEDLYPDNEMNNSYYIKED